MKINKQGKCLAPKRLGNVLTISLWKLHCR